MSSRADGLRHSWQRWGRPAVAGVLGGVVTWFAFVAATPVPLLDWFDLGVHEAGHLVAIWLPEIVMFMAGSFAQIAFPLVMAGYFGWRQGDVPAAGFFLIWAGASAWDVSVYAGDAVARALPLVGGGEHDWFTILSHYDALHLTDQVSAGIRNGGLLLAIAGFAVILIGAFRRDPVGNRPSLVVREAVPLAPASNRSTASPMEDPWVAAARLPFHHEDRRSA